MKANSLFQHLSNYTLSKFALCILFLFSLFVQNGFAQSNNCAATPTLTVGATCVPTNYNVASTFTDSGVTESCTGTSNRDGWFTFSTGASTTSITISGTSNRKLGLGLYSGACGSLVETTCTTPNTANASLTNITVTPSTTYRLRLMLTNNSTKNMTGTICVADVTPSAAYCTPTNTYSTSYYISGVTTTGGVANISNTPTGFSAYTNYSAQFVSQVSGNSFTINATHPSSTYGYSVWVDWNNDLDFNDVGENVISTAYLSSPVNLGSVTIPAGQAPGNYRMRIRNAYLSNPAPACGSFNYGEAEDYTIRVIAPAACTGTPLAGTTTTSPTSGNVGSSYTVSASGFTNASGLTFQWQYSTNGGGSWTNQGAATGTYSSYVATAPVLGTTVLWHLIVTCTSSGQSVTSNNASFTSVSVQNIPATGNNAVTCGTNIILYDNGGSAADYADNSDGYTVLNAGVGATINIAGNYTTEGSLDFIRIYNGTGTGGTLLATYSGAGSINYTGAPGQTLTVRFSSDSSLTYSGFSLAVTYSGACALSACSGTPATGTASVNPITDFPGTSYTVAATGYTLALNLSYQWQYSLDNGTTWTNAGTASSTYANYAATAPASGTVLWHLITTCTNSGQTSTSSPATFVTMVLSTVATGCPNVLSGGLGLNGADPATITCVSASQCADLEANYLNLGNTSSYIVEPIAYNPPFAFNGLANPVSVNIDDVWSPVVNLPFKFCFYGNTYNQCVIGSNGVLTFNTALANGYAGYSYSNNIPISGDPRLVENSIFGVFHDINPGIGGEVGWELITLPTGCRALVASWYNVPLFGDNTKFSTGMMVLYENSNIIEVYIKKKPNDPGNWNDNNAVVGIQNATGTLASVPPGRNGLDANWTATNEAWRFVPNGTSITTLKWYEGSGTAGPVVGTTDVITVCPANTTVYTAEITYTLCDGTTLKEVDETTVTVNKDKVWDGSSSTDWNTASNWTPAGVPIVTEAVYIPNVANDPVIGAGADAEACSLTVEAGGVLTLSAGKNMVVTNAISVAAGGTFNVMNSANLVQINDAALNTGTINMERITNVRLQDYSYWSSPVNTFPVQSVSPSTPGGYIFKWGTTTPNANGGQGTWVNTAENMIPTKGYIIRAPNGFSNAATSPLTANFTGVPNNGVFSPTIYRGTDFTGIGTQGMMRAPTDDNWNLIGNPYPSALGVNEFLSLPANNSIVGGVRIWTHGQLPTNAVDPFYQNYVFNYYPSDYVAINLTGATSGPGDPKIGAGQGFMVLMDAGAAGSGSVTFNNAMRNASFANTMFYRNATATTVENTVEQNRIWLDLVAPSGSVNRMLVGYVTNATQEEDHLYDSFTDYKPSQNFYSMIGEAPMAIQGRALPFDVNDRVTLGVTIPQNGNYSIAISALDGLFETTNQNIYLEDNATNLIHDLRQNPYTFSATTGNYPNRFTLRFTNNTLGADGIINDAANVWMISDADVTIKSSATHLKAVRVYDVLGRLLGDYKEVNTGELTITNLQKNNAPLLLQITLSNGVVVTKKVIY